MKKIIAAAVIALGLAGCGNLDMLDTNYTYNYALTKWPDGTIYLLSMNNTILVREAGK